MVTWISDHAEFHIHSVLILSFHLYSPEKVSQVPVYAT